MTEPQWLTEVFKTLEGPHEEVQRLWWTHAANAIQKNSEGFVGVSYNVDTDNFEWRFGPGSWPKLTDPKTGTYFTDDPFRGRRDDIPVVEFMAYLRDWYWPQRQALHWQTPEKAEVV